MPSIRLCSLLLSLGLALAAPPLAAQVTSAFTYQGELRTGGNPADANFDMEFRLFDAESGGAQIGPLVARTNVPVSRGLFNVQLDFGAAQFAGDRQWLEVRIKPAGAGSYETLSPRSEVTATPYALGAVAALANSVTTTSVVDGSLAAADTNPASIQSRVAGTCAAGSSIRTVAADGSVSCEADDVGTGTVTSIATGAGLSGGPITASGTISVAPGGIGATEINATQVQRRVTGTCPSGQYVQEVNADGTVTCGADATGTPGWGLSGNGGTNPATNFIGTTDAQAFVVRTQNVPSLRIEPSAILFGGAPITTNTVAGSSANNISAGVRGATIAGGGVPSGDSDLDFDSEAPNRVTDAYGTVGGGYANRAGDEAGTVTDRAFATVGGGQANAASGSWSNVDGGFANIASRNSSTVGGGASNVAGGGWSTVAGGVSNTASGSWSTVGGGDTNIASGDRSAVAGGQLNTASGFVSTIGGGGGNTASGSRSTIGGGSFNCAGGDRSWAAGTDAKVRPGSDAGAAGNGCVGVALSGDANGDNGTFVWADDQFVDFVSTGPRQFLVRAQGGMAINSNDPVSNALRVNGTLRVDTLGGAAATTLCRNANNQISACSSSARYKRDIVDLSLGLDTALRLRAVGYRWKNTGAADVGFVAEEVAKIDERLVVRNDAGDIEGVKYDRLTAVLANAVQELAARESLAEETIAELAKANAELRARVDRLEALQVERTNESR